MTGRRSFTGATSRFRRVVDETDDDESPRGPGRWNEAAARAGPASLGDDDDDDEPAPEPRPEKRGRGRPRKAAAVARAEEAARDEEEEEDDGPAREPVQKRGRGRPRKAAPVATAEQAAREEGEEEERPSLDAVLKETLAAVPEGELVRMLAALAKAPPAIARALAKQVARTSDALQEAKQHRKTDLRKVSLEEWHGMFPDPPDEVGVWTAEEERVLQAHWKRDPLQSYLRQAPIPPYLATLSKMTTTLYRMPPERMLSLDYSFTAYDNRRNGMVEIGGRQRPSPLWASTFCEAFRTAASHPFWKGDPSRLMTAVKYAVVCRTNDVRTRTFRHPGLFLDDRFLEAFVDALRDRQLLPVDERPEVPAVRREVAKRFARAHRGRSDWLVLFDEIEKKAWTPAARAGGDARPSGTDPADRYKPFWVTTADWNAVAAAVGATHGMAGHPGPWETDVWEYVASDAYDKGSHPVQEESRHAIVWAALQDKRTRARMRRDGRAVGHLTGESGRDARQAEEALNRDLLAIWEDNGEEEGGDEEWGGEEGGEEEWGHGAEEDDRGYAAEEEELGEGADPLDVRWHDVEGHDEQGRDVSARHSPADASVPALAPLPQYLDAASIARPFSPEYEGVYELPSLHDGRDVLLMHSGRRNLELLEAADSSWAHPVAGLRLFIENTPASPRVASSATLATDASQHGSGKRQPSPGGGDPALPAAKRLRMAETTAPPPPALSLGDPALVRQQTRQRAADLGPHVAPLAPPPAPSPGVPPGAPTGPRSMGGQMTVPKFLQPRGKAKKNL